jgi:hypothetical protein
MAPTSLESARHKFNGSTPYCVGPHYFFPTVQDFSDNFHSVPTDCMIGVYNDRTPVRLEVQGGKLIEAVSYDDGSFHLFLLKKGGSDILLKFPQERTTKYIPGVTFSFICTADEPYLSILRESIEFYKSWMPENFEISVVLFGDSELPEGVRVQREPMEKFHMAYARNQSLRNATHDHVFLLDVDVRMTYSQASKIIGKFQDLPNSGVFNLKNDPYIGNGLYFGSRHVMLRNGYDERFQKFWFEDTEHLMNYSRIGIIPMVVFSDFQRIDHGRDKTFSVGLDLNFNLFSNILNDGTRACSYQP